MADASKILSLLYLKGDYLAAYEGLAPETRRTIGPSALKALAETLKSKHGNVLSLQAESFAIMPGERAMTLFYVGEHAGGKSYHRIVVVGDANGYQVSGLWFADQPYPEGRLRKRFPVPMEVR